MGYQWQFTEALRWLPYIAYGLGNTLAVAVSSMCGGIVIGVIVSVVRVAGWRPWAGLAAAYTEFFRNTPVLAQLNWVFYALPFVTGFAPGSFAAAWVALSLNMGAFLSELFRAGITSIASGQWEAARSLGMDMPQVYRRVILPQAIRRVFPPLVSYWVHLLKDTSIVSVVVVMELMYRARWAAYRTYLYIEIFTMVGLIYVVLAWPQARLADWLYEKYRVKQ
jgi:polar amino acid transport system permease protein